MGVVGDGGGSTPDFSSTPLLTFFFGFLPEMVISRDNHLHLKVDK